MSARQTTLARERSWLLWWRRFDLDQALQESGLPVAAVECIERVMSRLRLWPGERAEVASELIAHFVDGIEAGRSLEELIANFGHPARTAALITRAKKRQRGWRWHAFQAVVWIGIGMVLFYSVLAYRFYSRRPEPRVDYVAILNAKAKAVPENARAYPAYVETLETLETLESLKSTTSFVLQIGRPHSVPGDEEWDEIVAVLQKLAPILKRAREAAGRPAMGYLLSAEKSQNAPPRVWKSVSGLNGSFVKLARLLKYEALEAANTGNSNLALSDIHALLSMADHLGEIPVLLHGMLAITVDATAFSTLGQVLFRYPDLFNDNQLRALAGRLETRERTLAPYYEGEHLFFKDVIQRMYTDDGHGGGQLAADWTSVFDNSDAIAGAQPLWQRLGIRAVMPLVSLAAPDRREVLRVHRAVIDAVIADTIAPSKDLADRIREITKPLSSVAFGMPHLYFPLGQGEFVTDVDRQRRALLLAIALTRYRREQGAWPPTLDVVIPQFIRAVPSDRLTERPLGYHPENGHPVIVFDDAEGDEKILWPPRNNR